MDPSDYDGPRGVNGPFILAIDIARFTDLERFRAEVEAQCAAVTGSLPAGGGSRAPSRSTGARDACNSRARRSANPRFDLARPGSAGEEHRVALPADSVAAC